MQESIKITVSIIKEDFLIQLSYLRPTLFYHPFQGLINLHTTKM